MKNDREYRSMELRAAEQTEDKNYIVDGYATTFDSPYELYRDGKYIVMEQVDRHAFDEAYTEDTIFQYDHSGMVYARTRNDTLKLEVNDHGLKVTADLSSTEASRGVWDAIDKGLIDRMSFAFTVTGDSYEEEEIARGHSWVEATCIREKHCSVCNAVEGGKGGKTYGSRSAYALETQFFPDSVNHPQWQQPFVKAGERYHSETCYIFT